MTWSAREQDVRRSAARAQRMRQLRDRVAARSAWAVIGWVFALLARRWAGKYDSERTWADALPAALRDANGELQAAQRHLVKVTKNVPAVIGAKMAADTAEAQAGREHTAAVRAARSAAETMVPMSVEPPSVRGNDGD